MRESDRAAFVDLMIDAVATKVWRDLSEHARGVLPVVGAHTALLGRDESISIERIGEHSGLKKQHVEAALDELIALGQIVRVDVKDGGPSFQLVGMGLPIPEKSAPAESLQALIDEGGVKVYGDLTINVEEPSVELMRLVSRLAELLARQASAREKEASRIAHRVEITKYREPIGRSGSPRAHGVDTDL